MVQSELTYDLKLQRCGGCTQNPQFNIFYNNLSSGSPWAIFVLNALFWYLIVIKYHQSFLEVLRGKQIKLNNKFILFLCFAFRYLPRVGVLSPMHIVLEYIRNSLDFCADWGKFLYYNLVLTHNILVQVNKRCPNSIIYYRIVCIVSSTPASTSTSRRSFFFL